MAIVPMKNCALVALVDDEDVVALGGYRWGAHTAGRDLTYAIAYQAYKRIAMHRLIAGVDGLEVDHINGDGLDNRRSNLRAVPHHLNLANQRPQVGRTSRFRGVHWDASRDRWKVELKFLGRNRHVGRFEDEVEAACAYNAAASDLWGEFARLNEIP